MNSTSNGDAHTQSAGADSDKGPLIALLGHTGNLNLGDEAITQSVIANLKSRIPNARFCFFTINPKDSEERYGYPAFRLRPADAASVSSLMYRNWQSIPHGTQSAHSLSPLYERDGWTYTDVEWRPTIKQRIRSLLTLVTRGPSMLLNERRFNSDIKKRMQDIDLLVFTGSNQFLDNYGEPWAFPYTLRRWATLAIQTNTPLAFASVGAGPIYAQKSMQLLRQAIDLSSYVSVRDKPSRNLLLAGGCEDPIHVRPDLAFGLPVVAEMARLKNIGRPVIGINPMPVYSPAYWYVADETIYRNYVQSLAELVGYLAAKDIPFFFFPTQARDQLVVDDVFEFIEQHRAHALHGADPETLTRRSDSVDELNQVIAAADVIIATRFHGTVLGLLAGKPVIGMCYYRKAGDLLDEFGLQDYVLQLETLKSSQLIEKLEHLLADYSNRAEKIQSTLIEYKLQLDTQYDALHRLLEQ